MALDGITLHFVTSEASNHLLNGRVQKVYQPEDECLTFNIWNKEPKTLLVNTGTNFRIQLTEMEFENPSHPPPFCMLLRKYVQGKRISRIDQRGLDRVVTVHFSVNEKNGDDPGQGKLKLVIELMGRNSNLILVRGEEIIDALHRKEDGQRPVFSGQTYKYPPRRGKLDLRKVTEESFSIPSSMDDNPLWRWIVNNYEGFGPTLAREVALTADLDPQQTELTKAETEELKQSILTVKEKVVNNTSVPVVYWDNELPVEYSPFKLNSFSDKRESTYSTLFEAMDRFHSVRRKAKDLNDIKRELKRVISSELDRVQGAQKNVRQQLERARQYDKFKEIGDLIMANLSEIQKGREEVKLDRAYGGEDFTTVSLDPSLSPSENAQKYYRKYKKLKRGRKKLQRRISDLAREENLLDKLSTKVEQSQDPQALLEVKDELKERGYIEENDLPQTEGKGSGGPREYWVEGYKIMVGKNARQNDKLVRQGSRDDLWFHVKDYAGSHVVLVTDGRPDQVPQKVINQAARLAACNSKAKHGGKVLVSYTLLKYVDKPKGAKPGLVRISNENTVAVNPSEVHR